LEDSKDDSANGCRDGERFHVWAVWLRWVRSGGKIGIKRTVEENEVVVKMSDNGTVLKEPEKKWNGCLFKRKGDPGV